MTIKHGADLELAVAIGKSRYTDKWKNTTTTWAKLVGRINETHRTHETLAEFMKMGKDAQDNIKDIGGFVGGELREGRRRNGYVLSRSLITLDADFAPESLWDEIAMTATYQLAAYSTHKHTPQKPRLRLLIPLTRKVCPEEYEAIARRLAANIGIDYFDDTTYQPARLMYWPSTPKDGVYFFNYIDAPVLDPDKVLATYTDWHDTSFWPESSRAKTDRKKTAEKAGDPLAKNGLIGAFCRAYPIAVAIETFLSEVYSPCVAEGRYTYIKGSTAAGLVIYEDKFAYSNHGTDPTSGQLCNAFDLVRIHLYGEHDIDANRNTPVNKLPSWVKMVELARNDENVRAQLVEDKVKEASADFEDDDPVEAEPQSKEWRKKLTMSKSGEIECTIPNLVLILKNDTKLRGLGGLDIFRGRMTVRHKLPWARHNSVWADIDDAGLRCYLEQCYGIEGRQKIFDAVSLVFEEQAFHPLKDFIESTEWDGVPRVETLFIDYLGSTDTLYTRTVTRKALVAAVARVYEPGCKFDQMLTIVGDQGIGKSLIAKKLGGEWHSDTMPDMRTEKARDALEGVWIMELSELAALNKSDIETIKSFISTTEDGYRKAYDRRKGENKRQCLFIGTTNNREFLNDPTGNRRFWVIDTDFDRRTKTVWEDFTEAEVKQVWAEAKQLYDAGENIMSLPDEVKADAVALQKRHSVYDPYMGIVEDMLSIRLPSDWASKSPFERKQYYSATEDYQSENDNGVRRDRVCAVEIWAEYMGKDRTQITNADARRLNDCLNTLGWAKTPNPVEFKGYGRQRGYIRPQEDEEI